MATTTQSGSHAAHAGEHGHHVPLTLYYWTFGWLMFLLILTLVAAAIHLGPLNLPIAIAIAVWKATLVVRNFMHLRYGTRLVQVFGVAALFWLAILFTLTLGDYMARMATSSGYAG
jgi:cytochrome c oxidase subunit 4